MSDGNDKIPLGDGSNLGSSDRSDVSNAVNAYDEQHKLQGGMDRVLFRNDAAILEIINSAISKERKNDKKEFQEILKRQEELSGKFSEIWSFFQFIMRPIVWITEPSSVWSRKHNKTKTGSETSWACPRYLKIVIFLFAMELFLPEFGLRQILANILENSDFKSLRGLFLDKSELDSIELDTHYITETGV